MGKYLAFWLTVFCVLDQCPVNAQLVVNESDDPGSIVVLYGTSSSGKTTIAKALLGQHERWTVDGFDLEYKKILMLHNIDLNSKKKFVEPEIDYRQLLTNIFEKAVDNSMAGTSTVLDLVPLAFENYSVIDLFDQYVDRICENCPVFKMLIHCPFHLLIDRVIHRNREAISKGDLANIRFGFHPFLQYASLFTFASIGDVVIDWVSDDQIDRAVTTFGGGREKNRYEFKRRLGVLDLKASKPIPIKAREKFHAIFTTWDLESVDAIVQKISRFIPTKNCET